MTVSVKRSYSNTHEMFCMLFVLRSSAKTTRNTISSLRSSVFGVSRCPILLQNISDYNYVAFISRSILLRIGELEISHAIRLCVRIYIYTHSSATVIFLIFHDVAV